VLDVAAIKTQTLEHTQAYKGAKTRINIRKIFCKASSSDMRIGESHCAVQIAYARKNAFL
jgi:hypothetical protein